MTQYFKAPIDKNGNVLQLIVNHDEKTVKYGYALFMWKDSIKVKSKKALRDLHDDYLNDGYTPVIDL